MAMRALPNPSFPAPPLRQPAAPAVRQSAAARDLRQKLLLVVPGVEAARTYGVAGFSRFVASSTADAVRLIESERPGVAVVDWDNPNVDGVEICRAATRLGAPRLLMTTGEPERVPAALKCGVQAVLLKPFAPTLLSGRLGRLLRERGGYPGVQLRAPGCSGTNRVWPDAACPHCGSEGPTSFDFAKYRQMWYACLACDHVWVGPRRE